MQDERIECAVQGVPRRSDLDEDWFATTKPAQTDITAWLTQNTRSRHLPLAERPSDPQTASPDLVRFDMRVLFRPQEIRPELRRAASLRTLRDHDGFTRHDGRARQRLRAEYRVGSRRHRQSANIGNLGELVQIMGDPGRPKNHRHVGEPPFILDGATRRGSLPARSSQ